MSNYAPNQYGFRRRSTGVRTPGQAPMQAGFSDIALAQPAMSGRASAPAAPMQPPPAQSNPMQDMSRFRMAAERAIRGESAATYARMAPMTSPDFTPANINYSGMAPGTSVSTPFLNASRGTDGGYTLTGKPSAGMQANEQQRAVANRAATVQRYQDQARLAQMAPYGMENYFPNARAQESAQDRYNQLTPVVVEGDQLKNDKQRIANEYAPGGYEATQNYRNAQTQRIVGQEGRDQGEYDATKPYLGQREEAEIGGIRSKSGFMDKQGDAISRDYETRIKEAESRYKGLQDQMRTMNEYNRALQAELRSLRSITKKYSSPDDGMRKEVSDGTAPPLGGGTPPAATPTARASTGGASGISLPEGAAELADGSILLDGVRYRYDPEANELVEILD